MLWVLRYTTYTISTVQYLQTVVDTDWSPLNTHIFIYKWEPGEVRVAVRDLNVSHQGHLSTTHCCILLNYIVTMAHKFQALTVMMALSSFLHSFHLFMQSPSTLYRIIYKARCLRHSPLESARPRFNLIQNQIKSTTLHWGSPLNAAAHLPTFRRQVGVPISIQLFVIDCLHGLKIELDSKNAMHLPSVKVLTRNNAALLLLYCVPEMLASFYNAQYFILSCFKLN